MTTDPKTLRKLADRCDSALNSGSEYPSEVLRDCVKFFRAAAERLDGLAELLTEAETGSEAGFDKICVQAAIALRAASEQHSEVIEPSA